jgi:hypothetical protein
LLINSVENAEWIGAVGGAILSLIMVTITIWYLRLPIEPGED